MTVNGEEEDEHLHEHHHHHHHTGVGEICGMIDAMDIPDVVKSDAKAVFTLVAEAEGQVHGKPVENIHFHELGTLDALADVLGVCLLLHELAPDKVCASPVNVGSGRVKCAHGVLPVPTPATELLLRGVPVYSSGIGGELCTPHRRRPAAPLRPRVRPPAAHAHSPHRLRHRQKRDYPAANIVRAMLGEAL